jgi:hypothetical protein
VLDGVQLSRVLVAAGDGSLVLVGARPPATCSSARGLQRRVLVCTRPPATRARRRVESPTRGLGDEYLTARSFPNACSTASGSSDACWLGGGDLLVCFSGACVRERNRQKCVVGSEYERIRSICDGIKVRG